MPGDDQEIRISLDGDRWCALRGENLQEGEAGFGDTPEEALAELLGQTKEFRYVIAALEKILTLADRAYVICKGGECDGCPALAGRDDSCAIEDIRSIVMDSRDRAQGAL